MRWPRRSAPPAPPDPPRTRPQTDAERESIRLMAEVDDVLAELDQLLDSVDAPTTEEHDGRE